MLSHEIVGKTRKKVRGRKENVMILLQKKTYWKCAVYSKRFEILTRVVRGTHVAPAKAKLDRQKGGQTYKQTDGKRTK